MKISTKGRYALRLMTDIAAHEQDGFVSLKDVAARQEISVKYLEQIAGALSRAGFLYSGRGAQGGYRLAREPESSAGETWLGWPVWMERKTAAPAVGSVPRCPSGKGCTAPSTSISTATPWRI